MAAPRVRPHLGVCLRLGVRLRVVRRDRLRPLSLSRLRGGFTLVEVMVTLGIAALLLALAIPSYQGMVGRQQLRAAANDLFAAVGLTRSQAITRGARVLMVPADPSGSDWAQGWIVFVDRNGNLRPDPGEEVIFRRGPVAAGIAIRLAFSSAHVPDYLAYNGAGRGCGAANSQAGRWGTLTVARGRDTRNIKINMLGRARLCDPAQFPATCASAADAQ